MNGPNTETKRCGVITIQPHYQNNIKPEKNPFDEIIRYKFFLTTRFFAGQSAEAMANSTRSHLA